MGSLRIKDNRDEDLALFREMRKLEKEKNDLLLLQNTDEFDDPLGPKAGSSPIFNMNSGTSANVRKTGADDFLNSDNDKNDYEWLLTPPGTPLFPSLEMESQRTVMSQLETRKARPTALKSRLAVPQSEPTARNSLPKQQSSSPGLNTSSGGLRRPSSSGGSSSRPATPTGRPTANSTSRSAVTSASNRTTSASTTRSSSTTASKSTPTTAAKPSRSATPTSRPTLSSTTTTKPAVRARSSTPTNRSTTRPSTPPSKPASRSTSRASTPTRRPTVSNGTMPAAVSSRSPASSTISRPVSATAKPSASRPSSPSVRPKPWKPSEMPGFSLDTPPNLRTSLPDRPPSATRGRPGAPSSRSSSVEPAPNGRVRRQSCSPARGRPPNGIVRSSGSSVPVPAVNRLQAKANDNVSPVVIGTKMVERVINMRKLAPPKQDDKPSLHHGQLSGKSSSPDSSGFGRTLSKKSLDMAIRHMDIRRSIPGNLRPLMTYIPASSMYSVRSGPTIKTASISDSPHGTSSNASSEVSVNNNAICGDGPEVDDEASSDKGIVRSPTSLHGR
ncbi:uncharacterized serine-rich protein C215.13-like isoform X2 [Andrographis paniculata]|uniref:uncharacterized serine-rich protein C215.13-like isoform X2 n=1 Tax=Andrographis paniculata TaxID=175694 RepID=UPI0021E8E467|nr:uncharacterized serine-rich protein C215.13-like isoform X2 [Andrographis paniculata]